mmetsp:Transcript_5347/g.11255  ORF Transcript_5347/g.11255 Transcript_5347/m.11255 type:complete len:489 (+) Transcript_5347:313-1779(+)
MFSSTLGFFRRDGDRGAKRKSARQQKRESLRNSEPASSTGLNASGGADVDGVVHERNDRISKHSSVLPNGKVSATELGGANALENESTASLSKMLRTSARRRSAELRQVSGGAGTRPAGAAAHRSDRGRSPVAERTVSFSQRFFPRRNSRNSSRPALYAVQAVGFSDDPNERFRPTMEDSHIVQERFGGRSNEAFFGVYDGHGGRNAVEIVETELHKFFAQELQKLRESPETDRLPQQQQSAAGSENRHNHGLLRQPSGALFMPGSDDVLSSDAVVLQDSSASTAVGSRVESLLVSEPVAFVQSVAHAFLNAYRRVDIKLFEEKCHYVGTTAVTCFVRHDGNARRLYTANAGDARAVLCRNGAALRLSFDHKAFSPEEQQRIGEAGGFVAANRVNGVLSVSRALGDHAMKNVVIPDPYVSEHELVERDEFLLLACDGLWDVMNDEEAVQFVIEKYSKGMDMQQISRKLVKAALDRGSMDNISVMVVKL